LELLVLLVAMGILITVVGWIVSVIFKNFSFFRFPLKDTPGCWFVAALILVMIVIINLILGKPLSYGVRYGIGIFFAMFFLVFIHVLEQYWKK